MRKRHLVAGLLATLTQVCGGVAAQEPIDAVAYFERLEHTVGAGLARKTKVVDVRAAKVGEVIVTIIKGEGKETQSKPAVAGDRVVRNRCEATGNEEILVASETFTRRYEGPLGGPDAGGWSAYRPRGIEMKFIVVPAGDREFSFIAPWGERMIARPGDVLVQDPANARDTYRIQKAAFACTYEIVRPAGGK